MDDYTLIDVVGGQVYRGISFEELIHNLEHMVDSERRAGDMDELIVVRNGSVGDVYVGIGGIKVMMKIVAIRIDRLINEMDWINEIPF